MKKKIIIIIALVIVLILAFLFIKKPAPTTSITQTGNPETATGSGVESVKSTLLDLAKSGKSAQCTFAVSGSEGSSSGTTYVSGSKSFTTIKVVSNNGIEIEANSIMDGGWLYSWRVGTTNGTKINIDDIKSQTNPSSSIEANAANTSVDYKCSPWTVDNSVFTIPSDVQFTDLTQTLKQLPTGDSKFCALCEKAGSADKVAACKKSLNCN